MAFQESDTWADDWHQRTEVGFWIVLSFVALIIITSFGLNLRVYLNHRLNQPKELSKLYEFFSYSKCVQKVTSGPASSDYKDLEIL